MGLKPRSLVILETLRVGSAAQIGEMISIFFFLHSGKISKIAIIVESRWETLAFGFAGAGFRRAPVKIFPLIEPEKARSWIAEKADITARYKGGSHVTSWRLTKYVPNYS